MKAIIQESYGEANELKITEVNKPKPKKGEVLIEVKATSLNAPDWRLLKGEPFLVRMSSGLFKPKHIIKGTDLSGIVVELGQDTNKFKVGDMVYGDLADAGFGAFAEYVSVKEEILSLKPKSLTHLEAASLPLTSVTALQGVRNIAKIQEGERVLIIGASGGVGSYAIQLAKHYGAHVTSVTGSQSIDQAIRLGVDHAIDYTKTSLDNIKERYDVILAINGYYPLDVYRKLLTQRGRFVLIGGKSMGQILQITAFGGILSKKEGQSFRGLLAKPNADDLEFIAKLVDGGIIKPVIEKEIDFEQIPAGIEELQRGHTKGKIVAWVSRE